jgi:hypothetical protein
MAHTIIQLAGFIEAAVIIGMLFTAYKIIQSLAVSSSKK